MLFWKLNTSKRTTAVFIVLAALMILPQALAVTTGIDGNAGSSYTKSTAGAALEVQKTLSQGGLSGSGMATTTGGGWVEEYYDWHSTNGLATAAAFVNIDDSESYSYDIEGGNTATTAWASLDFSAYDAEDFFLGGFAFNPNNYAGTFVAGDWADSIKYSNYLYASSSKVSATQSFYGNELEELEAYTWAERGFTGDEWKDAEDVDDVYDDWDDGDDSFDWEDRPYPGYYDEEDGPASAIASEQYAYMDDVDIFNPYKPYKASASLYKNAATSSQSVTLNGEAGGDTGDVEFESWAQLGDWNEEDFGYEAETKLEAEGVTGKLGNVVYSSKSEATTKLATASQIANVYQADWIEAEIEIDRYAYTDIWDPVNQHWDEGVVDSHIYSSLIGTDSATAKQGSASVTQQITKASGAHLEKEVSAENWESNGGEPDFAVGDTTSIFGELEIDTEDGIGDERTDTWARAPLKASTLSGKSIATATLTSASICGNWKASVAKDMTDYQGIMVGYGPLNYHDVEPEMFFGASFVRMGEAFNGEGFNGDESIKASLKSTKSAAAPSFTFREADLATESGVWA
jgi:hypothetical protein